MLRAITPKRSRACIALHPANENEIRRDKVSAFALSCNSTARSLALRHETTDLHGTRPFRLPAPGAQRAGRHGQLPPPDSPLRIGGRGAGAAAGSGAARWAGAAADRRQ